MMFMACRNAPAVHIAPYWTSRWIMVDVILQGAGPPLVHVMVPSYHALLQISKRVNGKRFMHAHIEEPAVLTELQANEYGLHSLPGIAAYQRR